MHTLVYLGEHTPSIDKEAKPTAAIEQQLGLREGAAVNCHVKAVPTAVESFRETREANALK